MLSNGENRLNPANKVILSKRPCWLQKNYCSRSHFHSCVFNVQNSKHCTSLIFLQWVLHCDDVTHIYLYVYIKFCWLWKCFTDIKSERLIGHVSRLDVLSADWWLSLKVVVSGEKCFLATGRFILLQCFEWLLGKFDVSLTGSIVTSINTSGPATTSKMGGWANTTANKLICQYVYSSLNSTGCASCSKVYRSQWIQIWWCLVKKSTMDTFQ